MALSRIEVENFRGIRRLVIDFDGTGGTNPANTTTALIGENNCGKTSLLDALTRCLGPEAGEGAPVFSPAHFHVPDGRGAVPASSLRIVFTFDLGNGVPAGSLGVTPPGSVRPETEGARVRAEDSGLSGAVTVGADGRRRVFLEVSARRPPGGGDAEGVLRILDGEGRPLSPQPGPGVVAEVRERHPVIHLRLDRPLWSRPAAAAGPEAALEPASGVTPGLRHLEKQVEAAYHRLSSSFVPRPDEMSGAFAAARALAMRWPEQLSVLRGPGLPGDQGTIAEMSGGLFPGEDLARPGRQGAGWQNVALLVLLGGLLEAMGRESVGVDAEPVVVIEDAEAHLHPLLLASVWRLIERIPTQKILTTNSGDLLASVPMHAIRRLVRRKGGIWVHGLRPRSLTPDELRRVGYHVRMNRASSVFARCWLLVEGETEAWLLPELALYLGFDLQAEGVRCVEFAQCGIAPLVKVAAGLGIAWSLLADGDHAGREYAETARGFLQGRHVRERVTCLHERDVEHCLWAAGYADVYRSAAARSGAPSPGSTAGVIERALKLHGKPRLALEVVEAVRRPGATGVPPVLAGVIRNAVRLAREAVT